MKKGFTFVEVLTVIVIIGILAALLFPVLSSSMSASKTTVCISNIHQIQVAMTLYKDDIGEYPPSSEKWPGFQSYLGGHPPKCPYTDVAEYRNSPRLRVDYFLNGYSSSPSRKAQVECRETRGASYPLVFDVHHANTLVARSAGKRIYIYGRVDGSVAVEDAKEADRYNTNPSEFPCPQAGEFSNLK